MTMTKEELTVRLERALDAGKIVQAKYLISMGAELTAWCKLKLKQLEWELEQKGSQKEYNND